MSNLEESYKKFREKNPQMSSFEIHCYESGYKDAVDQLQNYKKACEYMLSNPWSDAKDGSTMFEVAEYHVVEKTFKRIIEKGE